MNDLDITLELETAALQECRQAVIESLRKLRNYDTPRLGQVFNALKAVEEEASKLANDVWEQAEEAADYE